MKIVTLIENLAESSGLVAEHGLSLYIDTGDQKILFDTGQSGLFIQNARKLGIDIRDIDYLIISHGHFDHTGGLYPFLEMNAKAKVFAKQGIFTPKYNGKTRFIGTEFVEEAVSGRFEFINSVTEIIPDLFVIPAIPLHHDIDTNFTRLYKKEGDSFFPDEFEDELFVVIKKSDHINILTACSHRGITNICETAVQHFGLPVNLIIGGFHMKDCSAEQYVHIVNYLHKLQPKLMGVCHCTGVDKFASLMGECDAKVFYNCTGNEITIK